MSGEDVCEDCGHKDHVMVGRFYGRVRCYRVKDCTARQYERERNNERDARLRAEGAAARQAAIVAWLRSHGHNRAADAIEAGAVDGGGA